MHGCVCIYIYKKERERESKLPKLTDRFCILISQCCYAEVYLRHSHPYFALLIPYSLHYRIMDFTKIFRSYWLHVLINYIFIYCKISYLIATAKLYHVVTSWTSRFYWNVSWYPVTDLNLRSRRVWVQFDLLIYCIIFLRISSSFRYSCM